MNRAAEELAAAIRSAVPIVCRPEDRDDAVVIVIPLAQDARELAQWIDAGGAECDYPHLGDFL